MERLALYLYECRRGGRGWVTSFQLGRAAGVEQSAVRRDITREFGPTGTRRLGYPAAELHDRLLAVLAGFGSLRLRAHADVMRDRHGRVASVSRIVERAEGER
jgi:hypothetical protein